MPNAVSKTELLTRYSVNDNGCWIWDGAHNRDGYGLVYLKRKSKLAHRFFFEELVGAIPVGLTIDHLCRVRKCVNPSHLEAVPHHENVKRGNTGITNKNKTHCPYGHQYSTENTYLHKGRRHCRACSRERTRRWREGAKDGPG